MFTKKFYPVLAFFITVILACSSSFACADIPVIKTTGTATVTVDPDSVTLTFGVRSSFNNVSHAMDDNAQKIAQVLKSIYDNGVREDQVKTDYYSVSSYRDYDNDAIVYEVSNTITVTLDDASKAGTLIDAVMQHGANEFYGFSFQCSNSDEAYDQALALAVKEAKRKADLICESMNSKVSTTSEIVELYGSYSGAVMEKGFVSNSMTDMAAGSFSTQIISGKLNITATVECKFCFCEKDEESLTKDGN